MNEKLQILEVAKEAWKVFKEAFKDPFKIVDNINNIDDEIEDPKEKMGGEKTEDKRIIQKSQPSESNNINLTKFIQDQGNYEIKYPQEIDLTQFRKQINDLLTEQSVSNPNGNHKPTNTPLDKKNNQDISESR